MAQQSDKRPGDVEVNLTKEGARVSFTLDVDAVTRCLEKDGVLTIRFEEIGSTKLTDLPDSMVTSN
ncbi:hypothetical protein ACGFYQ_39785 [Streptomyces sp. NPDC048258]|uniref:hypothetical protein n=1 Tax=Streptomyces sp. NPDC048258 TaxID=3365527 RepID=UPI0037144A60